MTDLECIELVADLDFWEREQARRSLMEFIPWRSPGYKPPLHLKPVVDALTRAFNGERIRCVIHAPPQHTKSVTIQHAIAQGLWRNPRLHVSYTTYGSELTRKKSRETLDLTRPLTPVKVENVGDWVTEANGGLLAKSWREGLTGNPVDIAVIDDPVKDRLQAESPKLREQLQEWCQSSLLTRLPPNASVICCMTRWHPDDLSGWLIKEKGFEYICLPAVSPTGEVLWPDRWSPAQMAQQRLDVGEYTWASLYQGSPTPRGGAVFGPPHSYEALPAGIRTVAAGLDLAYARKTSRDYSVCVVMCRIGPNYFVLHMERHQLRAPDFARRIKPLVTAHSGMRLRWYAATTETGAGDFIGEALGRPLEIVIAKADKFTRAIPYAAAWNAGRIAVPEDSDAHPWVNYFLAEHAAFTGLDDAKDDVVDAAVAAYDVLVTGAVTLPSEEPEPAERSGLGAMQL